MKYAKLFADAIAPTRKHPNDAGVDVYAYEDKLIDANTIGIIRTGITFEIPNGYVLQAWPKSRSNYLIGGGIIDIGYQGEIFVKIANGTDIPLIFNKGDAIAQLVLVANMVSPLEEASLDDIHKESSSRGTTGGIVNNYIEGVIK